MYIKYTCTTVPLDNNTDAVTSTFRPAAFPPAKYRVIKIVTCSKRMNRSLLYISRHILGPCTLRITLDFCDIRNG